MENCFTEYELSEINRQKHKIIRALRNRKFQCKTLNQLQNLRDQLGLRITEISELTNQQLAYSINLLATLLAYSRIKEEVETEIKLRNNVDLDLLDEILKP